MQNTLLAYVFGRRKDEVFLQLKVLLEPLGLTRFSTDHWGADPTPTASYREVVKKTGDNLTRGSSMPWLSNRDMIWVQRGTRSDAKRGLPADISHTGRQVCTSFWPKVRTGIEIALYQSDASVSPQGAVLCCGIGCVGSLWPPCNTHEE